jgi:hypothetical protein
VSLHFRLCTVWLVVSLFSIDIAAQTNSSIQAYSSIAQSSESNGEQEEAQSALPALPCSNLSADKSDTTDERGAENYEPLEALTQPWGMLQHDPQHTA